MAVTTLTSAVRSAGIYARISDDDAGLGLGVQRQEDRCRELARELGWPVAEVYSDNSVSAFSGKVRPGYQRLLTDVKDGRIDGVLAFGADRLHRNAREFHEFADLGVAVATSTGGVLDFGTAGGLLSGGLMALVGQYESSIKSARVRAKHAQLRREGKPPGGRRCFGLTLDRSELVEPEARLVREAAAAVLAGVPMRRVVKDWCAAGVVTINGNTWDQSRLRELLLSNWARGLTTDGTAAVWPALLDEKTGRRLDALLRDPRRKVSRPGAERHLLTGLLQCSRCGARMHSTTNNGLPGYGCRACYRIRIKAAPTEQDIEGRLLARLESGAVARGMVSAEAPTADEAALAKVDLEIEDLLDLLGDGTLSKSQFTRAKTRLDARRQAILSGFRRDLKADTLRQVRIDAFDMLDRWNELEVSDRRSVLAAFIDCVVVHPIAVRGSTGYRPERCSVVWVE